MISVMGRRMLSLCIRVTRVGHRAMSSAPAAAGGAGSSGGAVAAAAAHVKPEVKALWVRADAVCFDVDSTVITTEGIDELAKFHGTDVSEITNR
jgi:hypothetical protein